MKIIVLDAYTLNPGDLSWESLTALGPCDIYPRTSPEQVLERVGDAEIVLTNKVVLDAGIIEALPRLKYIGVLATGFNVVDTQAAKVRGIPVTNVPAYGSESVAQMVFAHIFNFARRIERHAASVRTGQWAQCPDFCYWDTPQLELSGQTLGLVGLGGIGQATARIARAFGMRVIANRSDPAKGFPEGVESAAIDEVFAQSDYLSLHCPLTPETHHLVNAQRLASMKSSAFLINTGRGPLVDESALYDALQSNRIAGAGLDVLTQEPPEADHPLTQLDNCFVTPHIAWATKAARLRLMDTVVANIAAWQAGHPKNVVNAL